MLVKSVEESLNNQIQIEAESSDFYLSMASWAEGKGLNGTAKFLFTHAEEERTHMLKLLHFINERGGKAIVPGRAQVRSEFDSLNNVFELLLEHELMVTEKINCIIELCMNERDYTTQNFMQWYVAEQIEEESLARTILDKLNMIGNDKGGLYLFDRDIETLGGNVAMPTQ